MKKRILLTIALILVILSALLVGVSAHSGRTDSQGGHYNRSTGEYHFHHGYPEHQHPNGECPYMIKEEPSTVSNEDSSDILTFDSEEAKKLVQAFTESKEQQERREKLQEDAEFEKKFWETYNEKKLEKSNNQQESDKIQTDSTLTSKIADFILSADWEEIFSVFFICFMLTLAITLLVSPYTEGLPTEKSQKSEAFIITIHVIIIVGIPLVLTMLILLI